jgi:membrane dipeptidase
VPIDLPDVSSYPALFEALFDTGRWSEEDLEKLSGRNFLRVFKDVEKVTILVALHYEILPF